MQFVNAKCVWVEIYVPQNPTNNNFSYLHRCYENQIATVPIRIHQSLPILPLSITDLPSLTFTVGLKTVLWPRRSVLQRAEHHKMSVNCRKKNIICVARSEDIANRPSARTSTTQLRKKSPRRAEKNYRLGCISGLK